MLYSRPGSLTVYTTAPRQGFPPPSDVPQNVAPNSYNVANHCIKHLSEKLAPFDTTEIRKSLPVKDGPSPSSYLANKLPRDVKGSPIWSPGDRFPPCIDETLGPGPGIRIGDPWKQKEAEIYHQCKTMRPRVNFPKYISNNVPSVAHPLDIRCFVPGGDTRMYPWRNPKRVDKQPGPAYDTFQVYTSQSKVAPVVDFSNISERRDIFPSNAGAGPGAYYTGLPLNPNGGIFLSKSDNPHKSAMRLLDIITRDAQKTHPGPADHCVPRDLDKPSPKACSAPFKSRVPSQGFRKKQFGPGPQDHFRTDMTIPDLQYPLWPYGFPSPSGVVYHYDWHIPSIPMEMYCQGYNQRWATREVYKGAPPPNRYNLRGISEDMWLGSWKHRHAVCNPKLGFLTSSDARGKEVMKYNLDALRGVCEHETIPGKWRNLKPKKCETYPYHECPSACRAEGSPGPIYETTSGVNAIKGKRDWFDPREWTGTGFNNSGCGRTTMAPPDRDIPGPKFLIPSTIPGPGGRIYVPETVTSGSNTTPGPPVKLMHEKSDSMWRAGQLGTFNTHLKGLGTLRPSAGGFHPHGPIDDLADKESGYFRLEDCKEAYLHQQPKC